ncbi:MAG: cytochrome C [Betaproteobacteria bacterium HGW-Betaproteobacteria-10]|jgi:cytochrome c553|nr:MAG: cytochrome C [Betaproteobacteria bacterium HGW-Betaproteobacteria-10]
MKRLINPLIFALATLLAPSAFADRMPLPANTPASYEAECGSCHLAFPPALLAAGDWRRTMSGLKDHFGSDAAVNDPQRQEISAFLERNAGNGWKLGSAGEPPRISQTARFIRKHREIPAKYWKDPRVKSVANCEACHRNAATGNYSEHDIAIPELRE